jgi:hypothetical protein
MNEQIQLELAALERLIPAQTEVLEIEIANLTESIIALKKLTTKKNTLPSENKKEQKQDS